MERAPTPSITRATAGPPPPSTSPRPPPPGPAGFANMERLVGSSSTRRQARRAQCDERLDLDGAQQRHGRHLQLLGRREPHRRHRQRHVQVHLRKCHGQDQRRSRRQRPGLLAATAGPRPPSTSPPSPPRRTGGFAEYPGARRQLLAADKLVGPNATNVWSLTTRQRRHGRQAQVLRASRTSPGVVAEDGFVFGAGKTISGKIDGGGGNDWLDYSGVHDARLGQPDRQYRDGSGGRGRWDRQHPQRPGRPGGQHPEGQLPGEHPDRGPRHDTIIGGSGRSILIGGKGK